MSHLKAGLVHSGTDIGGREGSRDPELCHEAGGCGPLCLRKAGLKGLKSG